MLIHSSMPKPRTPAKVSPVILLFQKEAKDQEMTAYAIAKAIGTPVSTVQRALNGETSPSLFTVESIADALGLVLAVKKK